MMLAMHPDTLPAPNDQYNWSVLHVRPRCEKKIAEFCASRAILCFLPLITKKHKYANRVRSFDVPLFTGYVFVYATEGERSLFRQNGQVANVLTVWDQDTLLIQLEQVRRALNSHEAMELFPHVAVGMKVMVRSGPLKGAEGYVHQLKTKTRIILNIDFIQQAVAVEVDAESLVPV